MQHFQTVIGGGPSTSQVQHWSALLQQTHIVFSICSYPYPQRNLESEHAVNYSFNSNMSKISKMQTHSCPHSTLIFCLTYTFLLFLMGLQYLLNLPGLQNDSHLSLHLLLLPLHLVCLWVLPVSPSSSCLLSGKGSDDSMLIFSLRLSWTTVTISLHFLNKFKLTGSKNNINHLRTHC